MTETVIATELTLTARIEEDGTLSVEWVEEDGTLSDQPGRQPGRRYFFHDGWAAIVRKSAEHEGMVELMRAYTDSDGLGLRPDGHVEPLLT